MDRKWWLYLVWIVAAMGVGFLVSALLSGLLHIPRRWFLLIYLILAGAFLVAFFRWSGTDVVDLLKRNWVWGLVGIVVAGAFVVKNVLSQPPSPAPTGAGLVFDLLWLGLIYGALDALFLSVMPVLATWRAFTLLGWTTGWPGRIGVGVLAFVASLLVTVAYHAGFAEYRGSQMTGPVIGNGVFSLVYLLTTNPLSALGSHAAMHIAAVLHGAETTVQLPPHY